MPEADGSDTAGVGTYEGWFTRIHCSECDMVFDLEEDPSSGQEIECADCHAKLIVEGR